MAIIGIIAGVGWPMYVEQGRTNNRTDAIIATNAVALALIQMQSDTGNYTWATPPGAGAHSRYLPMTAVGAASGTVADNICLQQRGFRWVAANNRYESCRGLYAITVSIDGVLANNTGATFIITTTAIPGRAQNRNAPNDDHDAECISFTLDNNGAKGHIATGIPLADQGTAATANGDLHSTKRCWTSDQTKLGN